MAITVRAGYEISYDCPQPTPMILALSVHPSRRRDLITPDRFLVQPPVPATEYCDGFGNTCHVIHAPQGSITISAGILIARGRDATDVAIVTSFGPSTLTRFKVFTDEVPHQDQGFSRTLIANT
jgi:hypothetical protein